MADNKLFNYGLSALQGASNSAASTVSAPIDGLAWLLRKAGVNVGTPFGGSDWMAQQGLTAQPKNALAGYVGEALGNVLPMVVAAKAPQIAAGINRATTNALAPRTLDPQAGVIVWHGSPHQFDAFDSSKIGTGEGAQTYGHGIYAAESPEVAMKYQPRDQKLESKIMQRYSIAEKQQNYPAMEVYENFALNKTPEEVLASIHNAHYPEYDLKEALKAHQIATKEYANQSAGALYKVDIPDEHIARMLDWDKPISGQSEYVKNALAGLLENNGYRLSNSTGSDLYDLLGTTFNSEAGAADYLRKAGIPGVKYLDGNSRTVGAGTSNYVLFPGSEGLATILERNGIPLKK